MGGAKVPCGQVGGWVGGWDAAWAEAGWWVSWRPWPRLLARAGLYSHCSHSHQFATSNHTPAPLHLPRWVGDATRVVAMAKVVTQVRLDTEAAALTGVRVPDHVDILADMASCMRRLFS